MNEFIYTIFRNLTSYPEHTGVYFNVWFWLLPFAAPLLIYCLRAERATFSHTLRVICAIGLTYILINLALHTNRSLSLIDYYVCQNNSSYPDMSPELQKECGHHINIADGGQSVFALYLGWIPAVFYVGVWEVIWRIGHRKTIGL